MFVFEENRTYFNANIKLDIYYKEISSFIFPLISHLFNRSLFNFFVIHEPSNEITYFTLNKKMFSINYRKHFYINQAMTRINIFVSLLGLYNL